MPKKSEGGWSGIGMANSGIDPTHVYFLNDHPTQIPPSEILGPVVQNCPCTRPVLHGGRSSGGKTHSCLKWPLEEIYNLIFEHLTYSAISVPNWNTLQIYFSLAHYLTEMIKTF